MKITKMKSAEWNILKREFTLLEIIVLSKNVY